VAISALTISSPLSTFKVLIIFQDTNVTTNKSSWRRYTGCWILDLSLFKLSPSDISPARTVLCSLRAGAVNFGIKKAFMMVRRPSTLWKGKFSPATIRKALNVTHLVTGITDKINGRHYASKGYKLDVISRLGMFENADNGRSPPPSYGVGQLRVLMQSKVTRAVVEEWGPTGSKLS
jgi:hypothetical protein